MDKPHGRSIEEAISSAALKHLAEMKDADFVKHLQTRGIHSLDDLARHSIAIAKGAVSSGLAFIDPEDFPVCYKFTTNPHRLGDAELGGIIKTVGVTFQR